MAKSAAPIALPLMLAETVWSSVLTIHRRTRLIAEGRCSPAEYERMVAEKAAAARESAAVLSRFEGPGDAVRVLSPWHRRVKANARRLSKA